MTLVDMTGEKIAPGEGVSTVLTFVGTIAGV